jgi:hypothetical protein
MDAGGRACLKEKLHAVSIEVFLILHLASWSLSVVKILECFWGAQSTKTWTTTLLPFHRWRSSITSNNGKNEKIIDFWCQTKNI